MMLAPGHIWRTAKVDDLASFITVGFVGSMSSLFVNEGVPLLRGQNIKPYALDLTNLKYISAATHQKWKKSALQAGDVVIVRVGYPGTACVIPQGLGDLNAASLVIVRPDAKLLDSNFLCYVLNSPWGKAQVQARLVGSAQQVFNTQTAAELEIPAPPLPIQQRIAGILSAYDELIENSQRRIQILEAMARALYREWFVHFRFPGHESTPRIPSPLGEIPQGWAVKRLDSACRSIQDGDWIETKDQGGEDYRLLQISNVGVGEFIESGNFRYVTQETFFRLRCNEVVPGDLLVARMPTPIGRAWLVTKMPWRMITAVDVAIIRPEPTVLHPLFLAQAWNEASNLKRIAAQASGTTRLRITRRELAALEFVVPSACIQQQFARILQPQSAMIRTLQEKMHTLRRTRDLLLPRLLSGQVDIANLPEPVAA
jgi:type I restriction enzyme S subunit